MPSLESLCLAEPSLSLQKAYPVSLACSGLLYRFYGATTAAVVVSTYQGARQGQMTSGPSLSPLFSPPEHRHVLGY